MSFLSGSIIEFKFEGKEFSNEVIGIARNLLNQLVLRVKGPSLGDYIVSASSKLTNLRSPVFVIDFTPSNFDSDSFPSFNVIKNSPTISFIRQLEFSVNNNVGVCSISNQTNIINSDSTSSMPTSSLKLKFIVSCFYLHPNAVTVNTMVVGNYCFDKNIVPNYIQLTRFEG